MTEAIALGIPTMRAQAPILAARRPARKIRVGSFNVGGDTPITVQSMTITKTRDIGATLQQIAELTTTGCDIVRVACPTDKGTETLPIIVKQPCIPVIADIHFNPKYVLAAIEAGCGAVCVNPDNIRRFDDQVADIYKAVSDAGVSLRIGVNAGSLDRRLLKKYGKATPEALVESTVWEAGLFEGSDFHDFRIPAKHRGVTTMMQAYRPLSEAGQWPLHLGVTKVDPTFQGTIESRAAFGTLLAKGIGDTVRASLSAPPVEKTRVDTKLLEFIGLRERQLEIVSCPSCGRAQVDMWILAKEVEAGLKRVAAPLRVAAMGRVANSPGEARETDLDCASGNGEGQIFVRGQVVEIVPEGQAVEILLKHAEAMAIKMTEELGEKALTGTGPIVSAAD